MKFKIPNKKYIFGGISIILILLFLTLGIINVTMTAKVSQILDSTEQTYEIVPVVKAVSLPRLPSKAIYRLYECGGKIGIYDADSEILIDIIDVFTSTLPKSDRLALKKGIDVYTFSELSKIIDDFSS